MPLKCVGYRKSNTRRGDAKKVNDFEEGEADLKSLHAFSFKKVVYKKVLLENQDFQY